MPCADFHLILIFSPSEMGKNTCFAEVGLIDSLCWGKLTLTLISMETELAEASSMQCFGLSGAEFGSLFPQDLN